MALAVDDPLPLHREQEGIPSVLDFIHYSSRAKETLQKLKEFMKEHVYPMELVSTKLYCVQLTNQIVAFSRNITNTCPTVTPCGQYLP